MSYPTKKLGEVVEDVLSGIWGEESGISEVEVKAIKVSDIKAGGFINYETATPRSISAKDFKRNQLKMGDILVVKSSGSMTSIISGRCAIVENDVSNYVPVNFILTLRANKNKLYPKYLYLYLSSSIVREIVIDMVSGSTYPNIRKTEYLDIEIPLPPLSEQKKIVAKLERVLAKIDEAKKLRAEARENTDNLLPAELHKIFEEGKKRGWEEKELGEISKEIKSGFACGKQNEVSNGVVHLRTHNIDTEGSLNFDKITQIPKDLVVQNAFGLERGDILFNNTNSTELVGKTALVTEAFPYAFSNHLTRIRVNKNKLLSEWVVYVFNTFWKDKYFESICARWVGQSGINQTALKKIKIPLPSLAEQKRIVKHLDSLSEKIGKIKNLQSATQNGFLVLEQSVLSKSFN